ncbi:hypothetical protein [Demequina flava]|uniref:hypothetical protein n=1 Tax=Demequina flava TaxID=1095025 RepID=UPI000A92E82A|nr:hypothetical protein [Demequina flava]
MDAATRHWLDYNASQASRVSPRDLCATVVEHAGPGEGRTALDIGAGAHPTGTSRQRRDAGSGSPGAARASRADLIHSAYTLPWLPANALAALWTRMTGALLPGGILAVDLFGERDSWAGRHDVTVHSEAQVRDMCSGLDILDWGGRGRGRFVRKRAQALACVPRRREPASARRKLTARATEPPQPRRVCTARGKGG